MGLGLLSCHFSSINHPIIRADKYQCWRREAMKARIQDLPFWQEPALTNLAVSYNHILWLDTKLALPTKGAVQPAHSSPPVSQHRLNQIKKLICVQFDLSYTTNFNLHLLLIWLVSQPHKNLVILRENKAQGSKKAIRMAAFGSSHLKALLNYLICPAFMLDMDTCTMMAQLSV